MYSKKNFFFFQIFYVNNNPWNFEKSKKKLKIENAKSTSQAQHCLTCQIGRDGEFSTRYGRTWKTESIEKFCERSSHTLISFLHLLSYTHFSNCVFSRAHRFSLDRNSTLFASFSIWFCKHNELFTQPTRCLNTFEITTL